MAEFKITVQKGSTKCDDCPFAAEIETDYTKSGFYSACARGSMLRNALECEKYDLTTLEIEEVS